MKYCFVLFLLVGVVAAERFVVPRRKTYEIRALENQGDCTVIAQRWGQVHRLALSDVYVQARPLESAVDEHPASVEQLLQIFAPSEEMAEQRAKKLCYNNVTFEQVKATDDPTARDIVIRQLVDGGPSDNRIDVVMMGDGYTAAQQENWHSDIGRLVDDMFNENTFASYLPLLNVWSLYEPSIESGIGTHSTPRNTPYGLYRQGTQLRGVFAARQNHARANCLLTGPDGCDFPSLIGNSAYYGGLGGEFTIGTQSVTTGTMVLRHEMGHNYANVGEEYDGGQVYRGVNSATSRLNAEQKWGVWADQPVREERASLLRQAYPWHDLDQSGPLEITFTSTGAFQRSLIKMSISGCPNGNDCVSVQLDGVELELTAWGTLDRSFYEFLDMDRGFAQGQHTLRFAARGPPPTRPSAVVGAPPEQVARQVCNVVVHDFGGEDTYHWDNDVYSAYPTWSISDRVTYRPTNEYCLMRNMSSDKLCSACKEGIWYVFLARMSLLDQVTWEQNNDVVDFNAEVVKVGQFRAGGPIGDEELLIEWSLNGQTVAKDFAFSLPLEGARGEWTVNVEYQTSEVRQDPNNLLKFQEQFTCCN